MADKIMLLDGNSLINRAYYGLNNRNPLTAPDGTPTGALYAFMNMLMKYVDEIQPKYACAAFDLREPTFRHKSYSEYKGTRKPMPDDLALQIPLLKELLDNLGITRCELAGYEADDIIGTLAEKSAVQGLDVVIISGDKDSFQLVSDKITVFQPVTRGGKTDTQIVDPNYVLEKYHVTPDQLIDIKAIMGDSSDNIPGVKGIGEKGAIALISKYGSLKSVYEHLDDITTSHVNKLIDSREIAHLSYKLATICREVPIITSIENYRIQETDKESLLLLFHKYGFRSLISKYSLEEVNSEMNIIQEEVKTDFVYKHLSSIEEWEKTIKYNCCDNKIDSFERYQNIFICKLSNHKIMMSYYTENNDHSSTVYEYILSWTDFYDFICLEQGNLDDKNSFQVRYIGYDFKTMMAEEDISLPALNAHDVMIAGYLLNQIDGKPDFSRLYQQATTKPWLEEADLPVQMDLASIRNNDNSGDTSFFSNEVDEIELINVRKFSYAISEILQVQDKVIYDNDKFKFLLKKLEMPLVFVLRSMEKTGFLLDQKLLDRLSHEMNDQLNGLQENIFQLCDAEFNLNSPRQLSSILYEKLGLPAGKKRSGGQYSTDADELERLREAHPAVSLIIEHRQISKLKSTFIEGLKRSISPSDHRVHTTFSQVQTATGRLSSSDPNLQNIPIRTDVGARIREVFISQPDWVLLDADYSQIELRLLAHLSEDEEMLAAFNSNQDIHLNTACSIFGLPPELITPDQRAAAKTVNFSIVYGISDYGLSRDLRIPVKRAHEYISGYNEKYPAVRQYLDSLIDFAKKNGYVETLFGRRRYVTELKSSNRNIRMFGERAAMNAPVQGTAADMIKLAMVRVYDEFANNGMKSRLILQVHDELIVESPLEEVEQASLIIRQCMENVVELKVPLVAEVHRGNKWSECK
ncbi:MAG: DNA polymerase I [Eubacteriales bacterium]|nr:DNA polymerase I [Eubacteriales bacterium]MDD3197282.1 DNA polymerase I [Eubacteriales bacterium]MDD4682391.1 DNA polymerase I [Eubacteriales bacterium]